MAAALAARLGTTAHHLDDVALTEGVAPDFRPKRALSLREHDVRQLSDEAAWVTEGTYLWWTEPLFQRAQAIIWVDLPWSVAARQILTRHVRDYLDEAEGARGLRERLRALRHPHVSHIVGFFHLSAHYYRSTDDGGLHAHDPDDMDRLTRAATQRHLERYREKVVRLAGPDLDSAVVALARLERRPDVNGRATDALRGGMALP